MEFIKTNGIVLSETQINEGDKMLTIYTDKFGIINAKAPGAKSLKRKDMAGINMFALGEYILTKNKQIYVIRECNIVTHFFDIKKDITTLSIGCYILEALKTVGTPEQPDNDLLRLALNCLYALSNNLKDPYLIKAAFEVKICVVMGVMPDMKYCMFCGEEIKGGEYVCYDFENHILSCTDCMDINTQNVRKIFFSTYKCISYIAESELNTFLNFSLNEVYIKELSEISEKLFLSQIDYTPKTLTYLKSITR